MYSEHRRCKRRRPTKAYKKGVRLEVSRWRGFRLEVWNNKGRHRLRYEWKLYPMYAWIRRKLTWKGKLPMYLYSSRVPRVFHDHTSTYSRFEARLAGCGRINELLSLDRHLNIDWRMNYRRS